MFDAWFWSPWLMVTASPASGVVKFLWASLQQSPAINPVAYVSSAEQGHSSASRGTFLEIIKLTESSFLHALCYLRLSAAVNIIKLINIPTAGSTTATALRNLNVFFLVRTDVFMWGKYMICKRKQAKNGWEKL